MFLLSCAKDRCKDTACGNGGVCVEGFCSCLNGWEGDHCEEMWNERFREGWNVTETRQGDTSSSSYSVFILSTGKPDEFAINNLHQSLDSIVCKRTSYYGFSFVSNQVIDSDLTLLSGTGTIDSNGSTISAFYILEAYDSIVTRYNTVWTK